MKKLLLICTLFSLNCHAQRTLPYPIIFIHGFNGNSGNWDNFKLFLQSNARLTAEPNDLTFDLNADQNRSITIKENDVRQYKGPSGNYDIYTINFEQFFSPSINQSNQSGAVKQGYALGIAVRQVLASTGADKVILFGHSMGGLAAREYIQTRSNWPADGQHHVAKLVTLGTPHGGSNLGTADFNLGSFLGYDEKSEAVRDLRTSGQFNLIDGVYLFGGLEGLVQRGYASTYYNVDVNSNGYSGDLVQGLNQKDLYTDIDYACIIGQGKTGVYNGSDGVVKSDKQNLNNYYRINADLYYYACDAVINPLNFADCHTDEPKKALFQSIYALDEPSELGLAYKVDTNQPYTGFMTLQSNGNYNDTDLYRVDLPQKGKLNVVASFVADANASITLYDVNGNQIKNSFIPNSTSLTLDVGLNAGTYYIGFYGSSGGSGSTYKFYVNYCEVPDATAIIARGPLTFCEGNSVTLVAPAGFEEYNWKKNGTFLTEKSSVLVVKESGVYDLQMIKCGTPIKAVMPVTITVNPFPAKPIITFTNAGLTSSSSAGNQWLNDFRPIPGATNQTFSGIQAGTYSVQVTTAGCSSFSDPFLVTATDEVGVNMTSIYPNPNKGVFEVKTPAQGPTTLDVLDLLGRQVYTESFQSAGAAKSVHIEPRLKGTYILRLKAEGKQTSHTLLIE